MQVKVRPLWLKVCCITVLGLIVTAYLALNHTPRANTKPAPPLIRAGQPMAFIYKNGRDNYFHVQNGTAEQDVYLGARWITFGHVTTWSGSTLHREIMYVCRPATTGAGCHRDPGTNKQWMLFTILPFPGTYDDMNVGPAIAFKADTGTPFNGSYRCFQTGKLACIHLDTKWLDKKPGTLHYLHYVNPKPSHGLTSLEANAAQDFKLVEDTLHGTITAIPRNAFDQK